MKKLLLSIFTILGVMSLTTTVVNAEEKSAYFDDISCQIGSREDFSCSITSKNNFTPSSNSKVYLYMVPNGEDASTVPPFEFDSSFIETNGNTINIIADGCFFKYGYAEASFDFVLELVNADGNGEKISYTANTSTLTKIETIGSQVEEDKKDEETNAEDDKKDEITDSEENKNEENTDSEKEEVKDSTITMPDDKKVTASSLEQIKTNGTKLTVESKKDNKLQYAWIFDGSKIESSDFNINLTLNVGSSSNKEKIESLVSNKNNSLILNFEHSGDLPNQTLIKLYVGDKFKNEDLLTLYYYNETTQKLEETTKDIKVIDGYITFNLEHCSDYVLEKQVVIENNNQVKNEAPNNAQTSSLNITLYGALSITSLTAIAFLIYRKKKGAAL